MSFSGFLHYFWPSTKQKSRFYLIAAHHINSFFKSLFADSEVFNQKICILLVAILKLWMDHAVHQKFLIKF